MDDLKHTNVTELHISAKPGANIGDCMREAVLLACREWRNVTMEHNGRLYRVLCNDLIACVRQQAHAPDGLRAE